MGRVMTALRASETDTCVNYCETDAVSSAVAIENRCDYPNPQGCSTVSRIFQLYVQVSVST